MNLWALVRNSDNEILSTQRREEAFDPANVDFKFGASHPNRIIPVVRLDDETPSTTEKLVAMETVEAARVTRQRVATAMTQEELDRKDRQEKADAQRAFAATALTAMQGGQNPTPDQLRKVLIYLLGRQLNEE